MKYPGQYKSWLAKLAVMLLFFSTSPIWLVKLLVKTTSSFTSQMEDKDNNITTSFANRDNDQKWTISLQIVNLITPNTCISSHSKTKLPLIINTMGNRFSVNIHQNQALLIKMPNFKSFFTTGTFFYLVVWVVGGSGIDFANVL